VFFYDKIYGLSYIVLNIGIDPSTMSASNMALDFKKLQARYPCNEKTDPYVSVCSHIYPLHGFHT